MARIARLDPAGRPYRPVAYSLVSYVLVACWLVAGRFAVWD